MEGGPFQEDWWIEDSKGFVPYLNVTAKWDGAPDQDFLGKFGGRGFPYCVIMNPEGEVIWEVRPTSREVLQGGMESAAKLQDLMQRAAKAPDDAGLAASVELLAAVGYSQRQGTPLAELEELAKTPGLDAYAQKRFGAWVEGQRFSETLRALSRDTDGDEALAKAILALYADGVRPPEGHSRAPMFWDYCTRGAINAGDKATAVTCLAKFTAVAGNSRSAKRSLPKLKQQVADMK